MPFVLVHFKLIEPNFFSMDVKNVSPFQALDSNTNNIKIQEISGKMIATLKMAPQTMKMQSKYNVEAKIMNTSTIKEQQT